MIDLVVVQVNEAYAASGVVQRLNLAAPPVQIPLREAGRTAEDLVERLRDWPRAIELRDRHAADLVTLMLGGKTVDIEQVAGWAYINEPDNGAGWQRWAFSVGVPNGYLLAHETGHNMGLEHERFQLVREGKKLRDLRYPGGVGFAGPIDNDPGTPCLITIMAYGTECFETEGQSPLWDYVLRFSNPNAKVDGVALGVRGDRPSGRTDGPAFAARHLNRMRRYVANWRRAPCLEGGMRVRLQASSGEYVVAVGNGGGAVRADQPRPGPRGRFTLVDHNGGPCVESGDVVSLHTSDGFYLRAARGGEVDATAPRATPWARFTARRHRGGGAFRAGDVLTLQARSGHYVVAEKGGGGGVRADRESAGAWARFRVSR
ncbi:MAG: hypothetical protein OXF93_20635 [Acidobacteria bacterium]|nr:hypothetical protein [Acidobacteriota bacterium]